jgi:hypothetical protein
MLTKGDLEIEAVAGYANRTGDFVSVLHLLAWKKKARYEKGTGLASVNYPPELSSARNSII